MELNGNAIYLSRGDTGTLTLAVKDSENNDYDFSDDDVVFTLKRFVTDEKPVLQKTFDEDGNISFTKEDTEYLPFGEYLYDVVLTHVKEAESAEDEDEVQISTVIRPSKFTIGAVLH